MTLANLNIFSIHFSHEMKTGGHFKLGHIFIVSKRS